jgi:arginine N-succinyltransferase
MVVVRPIAETDLAPLLALVQDTGVGLTTLPNNEGLLRARVEASLATFAGSAEKADEQWVFVMEDLAQQKVVGICAIAGAVGLREPWYSYRVGTVVHASRELGIFTKTPTLFLSNDHTGASELCSLFLAPDARVGRNGALLSKSRLMFMANFRERFSAKVIAELRGVSDANGRSPFWESLGRHFFSMDFAEADYLTGIGKKSFVAELMPKHPLYSSFLSKEAQAVIGETHEMTRPARRLLEQEGFRFEGHVDIFDAGPALESDLGDIDAVQKSTTHTVTAVADSNEDSVSAAPLMLISNVHMAGFRVGLGRCHAAADAADVAVRGGIVISADIAKAIAVKVGDTVRVVALSPTERG